MRKSRILLVEDEAAVRFGVREFLETKGYVVAEAETCRSAEEKFTTSPPDLAIIDHRLPDGDALRLLPRLKSIDPTVPMLVLTGYGSIDLAVRLVKEGAEQFLTKPVELTALQVVLERLLEERRCRRQEIAGRTRRERASLDPFLGNSDAIRRLATITDKVRGADTPVLIQGETGTGKSLLASWLHENGSRSEEPFLDLNCAGLSRDFLETELFGHEKGAFTGATSSKQGLFEIANGGTVFLDEIGDVDLQVQPKLLKVLEERTFRRMGDVRERRVDIRLIAATHQDLGKAVHAGRFRMDLYYRICGFPLQVPPLRERAEDIPDLARAILRPLGRDIGRPDVDLSPSALACLQRYSWPGNIRELRNVLERALLLAERPALEAHDLAFDPAPGMVPDDTNLSLTQLERRHIRNVLVKERGHVGNAAKRLGIPRSTLYQKLKRYAIDPSGI